MFLTFNGTIFAVIVNFLVMLWIIKRFLFKPVGQILADRQSKIQAELAASEKALAEAQLVREDAERLLAEARTEQQGLLKRVHAQAEELRTELRAQAMAEVDAMKARAQAEVKSEREALVRQVRQDAASIALVTAQKMLERVMDPELQDRLMRVSEMELGQPESALV